MAGALSPLSKLGSEALALLYTFAHTFNLRHTKRPRAPLELAPAHKFACRVARPVALYLFSVQAGWPSYCGRRLSASHAAHRLAFSVIVPSYGEC